MNNNIVFTKLSDFDNESFDNNTFKLIEQTNNDITHFEEKENNKINQNNQNNQINQNNQNNKINQNNQNNQINQNNQNNQNKLNRVLFKYNDVDITKGRFILITMVITFIVLYMMFITKN